MGGVSAGVVDAPRLGRYRWWVCGLLFFASAINYVDRQVLGILKPTLQSEFAWSEVDYGAIVMAFQLAYAIGLVAAGRLIDRLGTRRGLAIAVAVWSVAAIGHAGALVYGPTTAAVLGAFGLTVSASVGGFIAARFALGLGEAANFPAGIKAIAEWFPRRERALAAGLFNAGTNVGAIAAPLAVPWLTITFGWRAAFIVTGATGFIWLCGWLASGRRPPVQEDAEPFLSRVPWASLLRHRQALAFGVGKLLTDPVWWVYLFWIPDFLNRNHGLDLSSLGPPMITIFVAADAGSIAGGWCSSFLIARGWTVNAARKTTMLVCALAVVPIVFAARTTDLWTAVGLISLAAAAHQGWSSNLFTLTSDMFPRQAVASVVGLGGMMGAVGGIFISGVTATILEFTGSYLSIFAIASVAYLVALGCIHLLAPGLEPARLD